MMVARSLSKLRVLEVEDLEKIHAASVRVLNEVGMVFKSQTALDIFKQHGAKVSGSTVYLTKEMIEEALGKCPREIKWRARNEKYSIEVGSA